jgi:hypothetical protein
MSHVLRRRIIWRWLGVAFAAILIWIAGWAIQLPLLSACDSDCTTFGDYVGHDPLCALDPTCISPLYSPRALGVQNWMGLDGWRLELGQFSAPGDEALAPPNYALFMVLVTGAVIYVARHRRRRVLAVLFAWSALQIASWFVLAAMSDSAFNPVVALEAFITLLISLSWLTEVAYLCRRVPNVPRST